MSPMERSVATRQTPAQPRPDVPRATPGAPDTSRMMLALQRTAGNGAVAAMVAAQRESPTDAVSPAGPLMGPVAPQLPRSGKAPTQADIARAETSLRALERAATDFARAKRRWTSANWIDFYGQASSNPRISWSGDATDEAISNALGNAVSNGAGLLAKRVAGRGLAITAGAIGAAIGNVPGAIVGFVVGVLIESTVGLIYDVIRGEKDKAALAGSKRTAALIESRETALQAVEDRAIGEARAKVDDAIRLVQGPVDQSAVQELAAGAEAEVKETKKNEPDATDHSLAERMIHDWVLEHAGDENDANDETSEAAWEAASERAFGTDNLAYHSEIFAYQTKAQFAKAGLHPWAGELLLQDYRSMPRLKSHGRPHYDPVMSKFQGRNFLWPKAEDPGALITYLNQKAHAGLTAKGEGAIRDGKFELRCSLGLEQDKGSVYVDFWQFALTFDVESDDYFTCGRPHKSLGFRVSPD